MSTRKPSYQAENIIRAVERMDEQAAETEAELRRERARNEEVCRRANEEVVANAELRRAIVALAKALKKANLDALTFCGAALSRPGGDGCAFCLSAEALSDPLVVEVVDQAEAEERERGEVEATRLAAGGEGYKP